jgi:Fur family ferric uptake transcriptional regulator
MTSGKELAQAIRGRGLKLTRQRQLILEVLESSRGHLDAETIYARAKERDPRIGIATVYRTLALLKQLGLAEEHNLGEDHGHFEAADRDHPHFHFTCTKCGKVVEFESPQILRASRALCEQKGLLVKDIHLHFSGLCRHCRPSGKGCAEES